MSSTKSIYVSTRQYVIHNYYTQKKEVDQLKPNVMRGLTYPQINETVSVENKFFIIYESTKASRFDCKPTKDLEDGQSILLMGASIDLKHGMYSISQVHHKKRVKPISDEQMEKEEFVVQRTRGA